VPVTAHPLARAGLSLACLSAWLVLLFAGWAGGGAVHVLFVAALVLFPWRALPGSGDGSSGSPLQTTDDGASPREDDES
jgi:hypothetical protein